MNQPVNFEIHKALRKLLSPDSQQQNFKIMNLYCIKIAKDSRFSKIQKKYKLKRNKTSNLSQKTWKKVKKKFSKDSRKQNPLL